ncbi:MAG: hypothetical protein ACE5GW_09930, partial [Planctomycetota bacterium]
GFGSEAEDLAEFHHVYTSGLDPEGLADGLRRIGFGEVEVRYRCSTNHDLGGIEGRALALLRGAARLLPLRSLHTHFILMAVKQGSPRL